MSGLAYHLGCPFWSFGPWNGSLFSSDARPQDRLRQYASVFNSVEGNTTFYSTPGPSTLARWRDDVPSGFRFCFKLPREITHERMLRDSLELAEGFLKAIAPLGERLGPFLVQLPPAFGPGHLSDLEHFLECLPREFAYAVELRNLAFFDDESLAGPCDEILHAQRCSRAIMDTRGLRRGDPRHPEVVAALHQKPDLPLRAEPIGRQPMVRFVGHPDDAANDAFLDEWSARVGRWLDDGLEPYFFVHTASNLRTPEVARDLHERICARRAAGELPSFPGERGERASGQLALL